MQQEHSCGIILYTDKKGYREYVLIMEPSGTYGFPKGHKRRHESDIECALRECEEETGIKPIVFEDIKRTIKYNMVHKGNTKEVTYFLGKYDDLELNPIDTNILSCKKYKIDDALNLLKFAQLKDILVEIDLMIEMRNL